MLHTASLYAPFMGFNITFYTALFSISLLFQFCDSIDTITSTQFISDAKNETLLSPNGNFKLGFFSPGNSLNRYLGIWFNKIPQQNVVWVANRDTPLKHKDGVFKLTKNGEIAVFSGENDRKPLWSSNVSAATSVNPSAKLLSTGNLVLSMRNGSGRVETVMWQSFDYPTDTGLAEMKFGLDKRTGLSRILTSWKSEEDPATGEYWAVVDPHEPPQFFVYKNLTRIWRGGPWNGQTLSGVPTVASRLKSYEMDYTNESSLFSSTYINNNDEVYITFSSPNPEIFRTLVLDSTGTARQQLWRGSRSTGTNSKEWARFWVAPQDRCDEYMRCGPSTICNAYSAVECTCLPGYEPKSPQDVYINCVEKRKELHTCGKGSGEGFVKLPGMKLPDARIARFYANLSLQECEMECLKGCNCSGYASANVNVGGRGCYAWYGELNDVRKYYAVDVDGQDFYIRVDALELAATMRKMKSNGTLGKKKMFMIIILTVVPGVLLIFCCSFYFWRKHILRKDQRQKQRYREKILADSETDLTKDSSNGKKMGDNSNIELAFFNLDTIIRATDNFSPAKKLGQGGFGPVYKGELSNGQEIAVKRLSKNSNQGISEFKNEALLIAKLQHRNLVRLLGCCIENEEKMLIYEYMLNKSLDSFIFDETRKSLLDWKKRHQIIVDVARGIMYLHQDSRLKVIHRDLKVSNILLDHEMNPKISDFGTARIFGANQSKDNTIRVVGTCGYMSPEYALYDHFSEKSDVYSFGVLLLEIISGRKNTDFFSDSPTSNLISHAWEQWSDDRALDIADLSIRDSYSTAEVLQCIQLGLLCVQDNTSDRPNMSTVVFMLSNEATLPTPKQPMFVVQRSTNDSYSMITDMKPPSANEVTITELCAR